MIGSRRHLEMIVVCGYPSCERLVREDRSSGRCLMHTGPGLWIIRTGFAIRWLLGLSVEAEGVTTIVGDDGSSVTERWWTRRGEYHRFYAPAQIATEGGVVISEEWYRHGRRHRDGGPAIVRENPASVVISDEQWWLEGKMHRTGGPARVFANPFGPTTYFVFRGVRMPSLSDVVQESAEVWQRDRLLGEALLVHSGYGSLLAAGVDPRAIFLALRDGVTSVEGISAVADGAPVEWARAFETGALAPTEEATGFTRR